MIVGKKSAKEETLEKIDPAEKAKTRRASIREVDSAASIREVIVGSATSTKVMNGSGLKLQRLDNCTIGAKEFGALNILTLTHTRVLHI